MIPRPDPDPASNIFRRIILEHTRILGGKTGRVAAAGGGWRPLAISMKAMLPADDYTASDRQQGWRQPTRNDIRRSNKKQKKQSTSLAVHKSI